MRMSRAAARMCWHADVCKPADVWYASGWHHTVASYLHLSMDTCWHTLAEQEANAGVGSCQDMHMACHPSYQGSAHGAWNSSCMSCRIP